MNPTNPNNLVAAWIQDWEDTIVVASSTDGGRNWASVLAGSRCTDDNKIKYNWGAFDPWVSFGPPYDADSPRGIAYLSSAIVGRSSVDTPVTDPMPGPMAAVVNRSLDGGKTWEGEVVLDSVESPLYIDSSYVIADQAQPGQAYAVWVKGDRLAVARDQYVARTTNGGKTWSNPSKIPSSLDRIPVLGQLLILPDTSLVHVFSEVPRDQQPELIEAHGPTTLMATRSTDYGSTWAPPVEIAKADEKLMALTRAALAPDATIYVSWQQADPSGSLNLMYAKSTDGRGEDWSEPMKIAAVAGPPVSGDKHISYAPSLAVAGDGTVGVMFYDHRNDVPASNPPKITDVWLRHSHDEGYSWDEVHLAGAFDQTTAPKETDKSPGETAGHLGEFQGIAPTRRGFVATFALASPLPGANFALARLSCPATRTTTSACPTNPTDVFFARVN